MLPRDMSGTFKQHHKPINIDPYTYYIYMLYIILIWINVLNFHILQPSNCEICEPGNLMCKTCKKGYFRNDKQCTGKNLVIIHGQGQQDILTEQNMENIFWASFFSKTGKILLLITFSSMWGYGCCSYLSVLESEITTFLYCWRYFKTC